MKANQQIYTVSEITSLVKEALARHLPEWMTVRGEITDWKVHRGSGHCYFALKDEFSQLPCVMWKSNFARVKFEPGNGLAVLASGFISVYEPQGRYQFYVEQLEPAGVGALHLAFAQMAERLRREGLFDEEHKKPLPPYPMRIGILTSESGAAVHDIVDSIRKRWPCARLLLYPVPVQGEGAAEAIARALRDVNRRNDELRLDVVILGRGGGSMEDLWAFNEEVVARAIFESQVPVISAVGHEVDVTIADYVADAKASTPTQAGVKAVPDMHKVLEQLGAIQSRLSGRLRDRVELARQSLETILAAAVFRTPLVMVLNRQQQLDALQTALGGSAGRLLSQAKEKLAWLHEQIARIEPHRLLSRQAIRLNDLHNRAESAMRAALHRLQMQLAAGANKLSAMNPRAVLRRGYTLTTCKTTGKLIVSPRQVEVGQEITTELADENFIESRVTRK